MWIALVIILAFALIITLLYLWLLERDIRQQAKVLSQLHGQQTNQLLHQSLGNRHWHRLIQQINQLLNDTRIQSATLAAQKKQLQQEITNISHDLKTPLTSAIGYVDLLAHSDLEHRSPEAIQQDLKQINERLFKLNQLVVDFFDFSKSRSQTVTLEPVTIIPLLEQSIISVYDDFQQQGRDIHLETTISEDTMIMANNRLVSRLFDNLLNNALQHGIGDTSLSLKDESGQLMVTIANAHQEADLDTHAIFEEFYTSDISRTKGGSGLGLAIVKEFVQRMRGTITATDNDGVLTIRIALPMIQS